MSHPAHSIQPPAGRLLARGMRDAAAINAWLALHDLFSSSLETIPPTFPPFDPSKFHNILDIGCGPGSWVLDIASASPASTFIGIESNPRMIAYAQARTVAHMLPNVQFLVRATEHPLNFASSSFDLLRACLRTSCLAPGILPELLTECRRLLRPRGHLILSTFEIRTPPASTAERMLQRYMAVWERAGQPLPLVKHDETSDLQQQVLQTGFHQVQERISDFDASQDWNLKLKLFFASLQPFLLMDERNQEESNALTQSVMDELYDENVPMTCRAHMLLAEAP